MACRQRWAPGGGRAVWEEGEGKGKGHEETRLLAARENTYVGDPLVCNEPVGHHAVDELASVLQPSPSVY